jgi:hypothetical protein
MAQEQHGSSWGSKNRLVLIGFLAIAAHFLWTEHRGARRAISTVRFAAAMPAFAFVSQWAWGST